MKLRIPIRLLALLFCVSAFLGCQSAGVSPSPEAAQAKVSISGSVRLNAIFSERIKGGALGESTRLAEMERALALAFFAKGAFAEAHPHALKAAELFQQAGKRAEEAKALAIAGYSLASLKKYNAAVGVFERALAIDFDVRDQAGAFHTLMAIVGALEQVGDIVAARSALLTGLSNYIALFDDKRGEARIRTELANVNRKLGLFSQALDDYEKALVLHQYLSDKRAQAVTLLLIARTYELVNDFAGQLSALSLAEAIGASVNDPKVELLILRSSALAFDKLGDLVEAARRNMAALRVSRRLGGRDEMAALVDLGAFYSHAGQYGKALAHFEEALKLARAIGDIERQGIVLQGMGTTLLLMGKTDDGVRAIREALSIFPTSARRDRLSTLALLGLGLRAQGHFEIALDARKEQLRLALEIRSAPDILDAYTGLGEVFGRLGKYEEAAVAYKNAADLLEFVTVLIRDEWHKMLFFGRNLSPYDGLVDALYSVPGRAGAAQEAFEFSDRSKARILRERLFEGRVAPLRQHLPIEVHEKEGNLQAELGKAFAAYNAYNYLLSSSRISEPELQQKARAWRTAEDKWKAFTEELRRDYPEYADFRYPVGSGLDRLSLRQGETLVAYKLGKEWAYVWTIRRRGGDNELLRFIRLPTKTKDIEKLVERFITPLRSGKYGRFTPEAAAELFKKILEPALEGVNLSSKLVVVPDGALNALPFDALVTEFRAHGDIGSHRFLGDDVNVNYYPSASILTMDRHAGRRPTSLLGSIFAVGDPVYGPDDERLSPDEASRLLRWENESLPPSVTWGARIRGGAREQGFTFERLKYSGEEVLKISEVLGGRSGPRDVLTGFDASESRVKSKDLTRYRYLHFAVHGVLSYDVPYLKEPALVLGVEPDSKEDGFLTLSEISGLKLNADLVTLSACKTGLGVRVAGEGVIGLSRAFMLAGARSVLVSLWEVADHSTALLMEEFYRFLGQGTDKAEALAKAKRHLREKGYENPFFWAAFVLMGD